MCSIVFKIHKFTFTKTRELELNLTKTKFRTVKTLKLKSAQFFCQKSKRKRHFLM